MKFVLKAFWKLKLFCLEALQDSASKVLLVILYSIVSKLLNGTVFTSFSEEQHDIPTATSVKQTNFAIINFLPTNSDTLFVFNNVLFP